MSQTAARPLRHRWRTSLAAVVALLAGMAAVLAPSLATPAQAACGAAVSFHGYTGHKLCGTSPAFVRFTDGTERMFVIGTDSAVWNIVYVRSTGYVSGWRSLGGTARSWVRVSAKVADTSWFDIYVIGADGKYWNKRYANGWMAWQRSNWAPSQSCLCT